MSHLNRKRQLVFEFAEFILQILPNNRDKPKIRFMGKTKTDGFNSERKRNIVGLVEICPFLFRTSVLPV